MNNIMSQFSPEKMMNRFFRKVDNVVWDLMSGRIGIATKNGITTIEGEGEDAQIVINMLDQFGMPVPAFAQNTPIDAVKIGDLIYGNSTDVTGWVVARTNRTFDILKPNGTRTKWQAPKIQMMGLDGLGADGVMVLRSLVNMLPGGSTGLQGIQGMIMPMLMMGQDIDLDSMLPMMLMSQMGNTVTDADGNPNPAAGMNMSNMMPMMMMMSMMGGKKSSAFTSSGNNQSNWFDRKDSK